MSNTIILKNGTTTPDNTDLEIAEPGFKKNTGTLYIGNGDRVVQINPIISSEEPERIPNALWIDTSIESSTEDSPLPISQGGTGANSAADALANLGAAPAGYGLGVTFPKSVSSLADLDTLTQNGWYVVSASGSTLAGVYFNHAMVFVQCRSGSVYQELVPIKSVSKVCRYLYDGEWSEWTNISPSAFAPSGYGGYGELCSSFNVTNETELESELTNIVNNIQPRQSARFTFMIGSIAGVTIGDWQWIATIHKTSAKYAFVSAQCGFGSRITKIEKVLSNGVWQPCEWVNPPMVAGVEYRTTERVGDRPVYAYLFNYGYYSTATTIIPHNLSVYQPVSIDITNNLQEILTTSAGIKELSFNRTNINISCDWNMGNVHFIMKYTK